MEKNEGAWRDEVISRASAYAEYEWIPSEKNVFHGKDREGVMVNTPDIRFLSKKWNCGWWQPGKINRGIPYNWGGNSDLPEFQKGISEGKFAGNVPELRTNGVSKSCLGVDCSGLVSNCWGLSKKVSTRDFGAITEPLSDFSELKKGDLLLLPGSHVMIFVRFVENGFIQIIDATRETGRVMERRISLKVLSENGYRGYKPVRLKTD